MLRGSISGVPKPLPGTRLRGWIYRHRRGVSLFLVVYLLVALSRAVWEFSRGHISDGISLLFSATGGGLALLMLMIAWPRGEVLE